MSRVHPHNVNPASVNFVIQNSILIYQMTEAQMRVLEIPYNYQGWPKLSYFPMILLPFLTDVLHCGGAG